MKVNGKHTRTIWLETDGWSVGVIDQTVLPYRVATLRLATPDDAARAIKTMQVRGAPLIGAAAASRCQRAKISGCSGTRARLLYSTSQSMAMKRSGLFRREIGP